MARRHMKKKRESRTVPLSPRARGALEAWLAGHPSKAPEAYLFCGSRGPGRAVSRIQAWQIIKDAARTLQLHGKIATHSMRKRFAAVQWEKLDHNLIDLQEAMGHASPQSTGSYIAFTKTKIRQSIAED